MRALLAILLSATCLGAQSVKLPDAVRLDPASGLPVTLTIRWEGDDVAFTDRLSDDIVVLRLHSSDEGTINLALCVSRTAKEGTYYLNAAACKGGKMSPFGVTKVTVMAAAPIPPPDPPAPTDALTKAVQDAYATEPPASRLADTKTLAEVYRGAAILLVDAKTLGDLQARLKKARTVAIGEGLPAVRKVINAELPSLGTDPAVPVDDTLKAKARTLFARIATTLEGVR